MCFELIFHVRTKAMRAKKGGSLREGGVSRMPAFCRPLWGAGGYGCREETRNRSGGFYSALITLDAPRGDLFRAVAGGKTSTLADAFSQKGSPRGVCRSRPNPRSESQQNQPNERNMRRIHSSANTISARANGRPSSAVAENQPLPRALACTQSVAAACQPGGAEYRYAACMLIESPSFSAQTTS